MRQPVQKKFKQAISLATPGRALEIGAHSSEKSAISILQRRKFDYVNLDISPSDVPQTVIGDICAKTADETGLEAGSFDFICATDVFEHLKTPWIAARNVVDLLKPGGVAFISTVWSWRYHPVPIDYWRFSHECLQYLFEDLECIEADFDDTQRRKDIRGFWPDGRDHVEVDELGGWRENWSVFFIGKKSAVQLK
ncbi:class I SAM-dependent methyltransferase [Hyphococcus flavus]|uniref:Class I SAM-dependent methyltransferase n=1 Tax=Hyphococcus flavus TaxID=1866326 RepID=A0AAE9ZEV5_9PROT|nr:class I SAM-dependent methyltransferase [Hyphococcus flavus]WDI32480.1 class I SAM-dependent methyltransferase [Hyphococcus flavus]